MAGLAHPLPSRHVSLPFGPTGNPRLGEPDDVYAHKDAEGWVRARLNPFDGAKQYDDFHLGVDYVCPVGTPVLAPEAGIIVGHRYDSKSGLYVLLQIQPGTYFYAGHLSSFVGGVGKKVKRGAVIAKSGDTGLTTGPHSHTMIIVSFVPNPNESRWYTNWFRIDIEECYPGGRFADRDWLKPG